VTKEVDQESRRAAESRGRTTITVDAVTPLAIFISLESGPESSAPLLSSLDDFPTLREMLGLPDRESSPEKMDDDDNNGLKRLFWIPPDVESPSSGLKPSSSALKPPAPASEPVSSASAPELVFPTPGGPYFGRDGQIRCGGGSMWHRRYMAGFIVIMGDRLRRRADTNCPGLRVVWHEREV
jgi:hypothetical protein